MLSERFLQLYNEELRYLREAGQQFSLAHPQVAQHLGMHADGVLDPFVERLLEGAAFLSTRIQERLNNEQPEFALQMLARLAPLWHTPLPSIATVAIAPDLTSPQWYNQVELPKGSKVLLNDPSLNNKPVHFTTGRHLKIQPLELSRAGCAMTPPMHIPESAAAALHDGLAYISLEFTTRGVLSLAELDLNPLHLTLAGDAVRANQLLTTLLNHSLRIVLWAKDESKALSRVLDTGQLRLGGLSDEEALLPVPLGELPGSRLLREYFAAPSRFFSLELHGMNDFLQQAGALHEFGVLFVLNQRPLALLDRVSAQDFRLFATPIINLYRRRCNPVTISSEHIEHPLIVDRLNPRLYEIHHLLSVTGLLAEGGSIPFSSLHGDCQFAGDEQQAGYVVRRRREPTAAPARQQRLPYDDLFISLSPGSSSLEMDDVRSLAIEAMVCERHFIPSHLQQPCFQLETALPIRQVEMLRHPTPQQGVPDIALAWQALQLLANNPLRYAQPEVSDCAALLRDWLSLFSQQEEASQRKRIDSLNRASITHRFERHTGSGPIAWVRGVEATIDLRSDHHADQGAFLFGHVLHHALAAYCELGQTLRLHLKIDGESYAQWEPIRDV